MQLVKLNLLDQQEELQADLTGIQKSGQDKLRKLELAKTSNHKKQDIIHMLS